MQHSLAISVCRLSRKTSLSRLECSSGGRPTEHGPKYSKSKKMLPEAARSSSTLTGSTKVESLGQGGRPRCGSSSARQRMHTEAARAVAIGLERLSRVTRRRPAVRCARTTAI
eukprot:6490726-Amphidinium_carterae.1